MDNHSAKKHAQEAPRPKPACAVDMSAPIPPQYSSKAQSVEDLIQEANKLVQASVTGSCENADKVLHMQKGSKKHRKRDEEMGYPSETLQAREEQKDMREKDLEKDTPSNAHVDAHQDDNVLTTEAMERIDRALKTIDSVRERENLDSEKRELEAQRPERDSRERESRESLSSEPVVSGTEMQKPKEEESDWDEIDLNDDEPKKLRETAVVDQSVGSNNRDEGDWQAVGK